MTILMTGGDEPMGGHICDDCGWSVWGCVCGEDLDDEDEEFSDRHEMVLDCGYPGCCMPGYHTREECHNVEDILAYETEMNSAKGKT